MRARSKEQSRLRRKDLLGQLSAPMREFIRTEAGSAGLLLVATVTALIVANSPLSDSWFRFWATDLSINLGSFDLSMDLHHWTNDALMTLFFFVIGLEVRRELSVGELTEPRRAMIPLIAGVGGMVVPALLYLLVSPGGEAMRGWGIVIGTDTAFVLGALAVVGPTFSTQLRIFLLTLTVIDDIVAVAVIGAVYSDSVETVPMMIGFGCLVILALMGRWGVWRTSLYWMVMAVLWVATVKSGLHPSIAGMVGGLLVAAHPPRRSDVEGAVRLFRRFRQSPLPQVGFDAKQGLARAISVNERLQTALHPWTSYLVVPIFALANAGIDLRDGVLVEALTSAVTWAVVVGLVVGKYVGISLFAWGAVRLGVGSLPLGVGGGHVMGGAALSGIGFTVSLLIAGLAFDDERLTNEATVGVLIAAVISVALGWLTFWIAAVWKDQRDADLPRTLSMPVDPERDRIRGDVDAPLTLLEYSDFECMFCARTTGVTMELRERLGDRLRYVMRHLPLPDVHSHAELAAQAVEAAALQGKFWEMHDLLFEHQDELEWEDLAGYAHDLDLDVEQFLRDIPSDEVAARIREDVASAEASGARGTPTFYVNGQRHHGPHDAESLLTALLATAPEEGEPAPVC